MSEVKFVKTIVKGQFRLYIAADGNFGLNVGETNDPQAWYKLGSWKSFKEEVDAAFANQRTVLLSSFSYEDLSKELEERRISSKNGKP